MTVTKSKLRRFYTYILSFLFSFKAEGLSRSSFPLLDQDSQCTTTKERGEGDVLARTQDTTHRHYTPTTPPLSSVTRGWSVDSFFEVELPASLVSSAVLLSCCRLSYVVFSCTFARKSRRPQTIRREGKGTPSALSRHTLRSRYAID